MKLTPPTTAISTLFILLLLPLSSFSQEQNVGIGTESPSEKLEVKGIIFSSQGGVRFPDGSLQTTAYIPGSVNQSVAPSGLVVRFSDESGIIGNITEKEFIKGFNALYVQSDLKTTANFGAGNAGTPKASALPVIIRRSADENTATLRGLLVSGRTIAYIDIFYVRLGGPGEAVQIVHAERYENCVLKDYTISSSGEEIPPSEVFTFIFQKACYRSVTYDNGGNGTNRDSCFDLVNLDSNCSCSGF